MLYSRELITATRRHRGSVQRSRDVVRDARSPRTRSGWFSFPLFLSYIHTPRTMSAIVRISLRSRMKTDDTRLALVPHATCTANHVARYLARPRYAATAQISTMHNVSTRRSEHRAPQRRHGAIWPAGQGLQRFYVPTGTTSSSVDKILICSASCTGSCTPYYDFFYLLYFVP